MNLLKLESHSLCGRISTLNIINIIIIIIIIIITTIHLSSKHILARNVPANPAFSALGTPSLHSVCALNPIKWYLRQSLLPLVRPLCCCPIVVASVFYLSSAILLEFISFFYALPLFLLCHVLLNSDSPMSLFCSFRKYMKLLHSLPPHTYKEHYEVWGNSLGWLQICFCGTDTNSHWRGDNVVSPIE